MSISISNVNTVGRQDDPNLPSGQVWVHSLEKCIRVISAAETLLSPQEDLATVCRTATALQAPEGEGREARV